MSIKAEQSTMTPDAIISQIISNYDGIVPKASWGETSLFYNPNNALPNGVYFCTIKQKNGDNDKSSNLDREGVFRISLGIGSEAYIENFGEKPKRPPKGGIIDTGHDFTVLNELMPHPIYGWMGWIQVLNPTQKTFDDIQPLIHTAYTLAVSKFDKKMCKI